jgi:hypothetical protein
MVDGLPSAAGFTAAETFIAEFWNVFRVHEACSVSSEEGAKAHLAESLIALAAIAPKVN